MHGADLKVDSFADQRGTHTFNNAYLYKMMIATNNSRSCDLEMWETYEKHFRKENWESAKNNFVRINIYMADNQMTVTEEVPEYTASLVISDIGGQLGIWIGMSVLTMSETPALFGQLFSDACSKLIPARPQPV